MKSIAAQRYFSVLVTRGTTESALVPIASNNEQNAARQALAQANDRFARLFEVNENIPEEPYLGSGIDEDVEEISKERYEQMLANASTKPDDPDSHPLFVDFVRFIQARIDDGDLIKEDIATRLVRYALTPPDQMIDEFLERMNTDETVRPADR